MFTVLIFHYLIVRSTASFGLTLNVLFFLSVLLYFIVQVPQSVHDPISVNAGIADQEISMPSVRPVHVGRPVVAPTGVGGVAVKVGSYGFLSVARNVLRSFEKGLQRK